MNRILFKKMLRDIKENRGQFIAILIVVVLGVMLYTGVNSTFRNLSESSEKYYRQYRFADLFLSFYKAPESAVERLNSLPYVKMATGRVVQQVKLGRQDENVDVRLITLPDEKQDIVNDIVIKSGAYFSDGGSNQCLVEEEFYKAHKLQAGDYIYSVINGNEVKLKVIGSVKSPEYVYTLKGDGELMPDNFKFGIVYIKKSFGQSILDFKGSINDASVLLKDGTDIKAAKDDVKKAMKMFGVTEVTEKGDQISNNMLSEEMKGLKQNGSSFPIIFFIVAAVIIYIMMGRMVENQKGQIGMLKALGYSNLDVLMHYLSYSVFMGLIGSAIGTVFGMYLGKFFTELENSYFHLPPADMKIYPDLAIPASALTLFFCLLAGYNACKAAFRMMPSEAMRPKAPRTGRKILIEKVEVLWKRLDYSWKIILRNLFRYKRRALLTSVGIVFSAAIVLMAFGMGDSINYMVEKQYKSIQSYDVKVNFSKLLNTDELRYIRILPHVSGLEPVLETGVEISNGWRKKNIGFTALLDSPEICRVLDKEGNPLELPKDGILIPEKLAETLGVKVGDEVDLKPLLPGKDKKKVPVKGIIAQYLGLSAYSSLDYSEVIFGEGGVVNSAVMKIEGSDYEKGLKDKLDEIPTVASVEFKSDSLGNLLKNLGAMTSSISVMILMSAVLSIAVIYNIATINIFERQRELATLKVLGFRNNEIQRLVFNENFIITSFGIITGLPLGIWLGRYIMAASETDSYTFPFVVSGRSYMLTVVLTIAFTVLANFVLRKKIRNINMVEVLKSNE